MTACISDILSADDLSRITAFTSDAAFVDGRSSAGWAAREVKNNTQLDGSPRNAWLTAMIVERMQANELVQALALPKRWHTPLISRSVTGMGYGTHTDDAFMGKDLLRTDLSYTLFLSEPDSYEGGELVLESALGESSFKLPAGAAILYPSHYLHRVNLVTRGERLVAAGWIKSLCPDPHHRELLFDLHRVRQSVFEKESASENFNALAKLHSNLLRIFSG